MKNRRLPGLWLLGTLGLVMVAAGMAHAAALTANRDTPERTGQIINLTVKDEEIIYAGALVAVDANGEAINACDTNAIDVVGRAQEYIDNADDGETIDVARGVFRWANGAAFTDANIGDLAYVSDNQTVVTAGTATYDIVVGPIVDVDSSGVWVDTFDIGSQGAASVTTLSASGNGTVGGTLGVTGIATCSSNLVVTRNGTVGGTLGVTGIATCSSNLVVTRNGTVGGTLGVTGIATCSSNLVVTGTAAVGGTLGVTGIATCSSNLVVSGTAAVTGNTTLGGTLAVTGAATCSGVLWITTNAYITVVNYTNLVVVDDSLVNTNSLATW